MYRLIQRGQAAEEWPCPQDMPPLIHQLLARRGVASAGEARAFLHPDETQLHDPFLFPGMAAAVARIRRAREQGETVCVWGDYDVDGVSATAILLLYFGSVGLKCFHYIPDRHAEGYGLNDGGVGEVAKRASLLVTVDCGISCAHEIETAKSLGLDCIVTDHHRPGDILPDCAVLNPLVGGYPFDRLCGAGVAFKLVHALGGLEAAMDYVDLAALATVADLVPLVGENRAIVTLGLKRVNSAPRLGIRLLIERAGLQDRVISAGSVAFQLAPRINASGRLGDARRALRLLTSSDAGEAAPIADELELENTRRRAEEQAIVNECQQMMENYDLLAHRVIVLCGAGWNSGVIGLAASRLVQEYHYPVVLLAEDKGACVGSCRSIPAVDIFAALSSVADLMTRFGGHHQAAGLAMPKARLAEFIARLDEYLSAHTAPDDYVPELEYDLEWPLGRVTEEAVRQMEFLQPAGFGNPSPAFLTCAEAESARAVGKNGAHLQLQLTQDGARLQGVCFGQGPMAQEVAGTTRRLLYAPSLNEWRGRVSVQCEVKTFLTEPPHAVFARFIDKYPRYLRTYLTQLLYNIDLNSDVRAADTVSPEALRGWLEASPQGTLIAAVTDEGARSLLAFLEENGLEARLDAMAGRWSADPTAMNAALLCPAGAPRGRWRHIVLWDAPAEAFPALPEGPVYLAGRRAPESWLDAPPGMDALRRVYVTARRLAAKPMLRVTLEDIERAVAQGGGFPEGPALRMALAVLNHMALIQIDPEEARLSVPTGRKGNPEEDALYRRLRTLTDFAAEKE
ncbi:MAG: single-stranded-DNA-specific exonuclease RecJ [Clostridia bacterium]|nr:single-stranded-DNA-specific exonuclease RecJ [Clostridia bacterium]